jgi:hypothetical protein
MRVSLLPVFLLISLSGWSQKPATALHANRWRGHAHRLVCIECHGILQCEFHNG